MRNAFAGECVHIIGGGPSIADLNTKDLKGRIIAVNNSGLDKCPTADVLFVMDRRWFDWNAGRLYLNRSRWRVVRQMPRGPLPWPVEEVKHDKGAALSESWGTLAGASGGAMAINLAWLMGAARIVLHGFEMKPGHYHADHKVGTPEHLYRDVFIPSFERMAEALRGRCEVVNATPGSALTCFPQG